MIGHNVGYGYQSNESTQFDQASTSYGAANPSAAIDSSRAPAKQENVAPPPYEPPPQQKSDTRPTYKQRSKNPLVV